MTNLAFCLDYSQLKILTLKTSEPITSSAQLTKTRQFAHGQCWPGNYMGNGRASLIEINRPRMSLGIFP